MSWCNLPSVSFLNKVECLFLYFKGDFPSSVIFFFLLIYRRSLDAGDEGLYFCMSSTCFPTPLAHLAPSGPGERGRRRFCELHTGRPALRARPGSRTLLGSSAVWRVGLWDTHGYQLRPVGWKRSSLWWGCPSPVSQWSSPCPAKLGGLRRSPPGALSPPVLALPSRASHLFSCITSVPYSNFHC